MTTQTAEHGAHDAHPDPRRYVAIAVILAVITAAEVAISYIDMPHAILITGLIILSIVKFGLVARWFMHLRFDSKVLQRLFLTGILLAMSVYVAVLLIFGIFR